MNAKVRRFQVILVSLALSAAGCASGTTIWTPGISTPAPTAQAKPVAATVTQPPQTAAPTSVAQTPAASTSAAAPAQGGSITIKAFDLGFDPSMVKVPSAGAYQVTFQNTGAIAHDLTFDDGTKIAADPGQTATGTVTVPDGGLGFICSVPGHSAAGMTGKVMVEQTAAAGSPAAGGSPAASDAPGASPAASHNPDDHGGPAAAVPGVDPDPNAPVYKLYDATAPAPLPGTVHDIDLVITEQAMTVAPGYVVDVWTFGGTVPGPVIRVRVGDTINVHLINPAQNQLSHSIDFHASQVAWNDEMTSIAPGQEKLYTWTADYAGVWMYHCGTAPALHHIANGMYGMVIVDPKEGLPKVDHEFALVQSEWYIDAQGQPASLTKASAGAPSPDFVVFNGVANQYKDNPLKVGTGERVRFFILDAGPNIDSSFHIVGTIFDRVIKEGVLMDASTNGGWASQAVDLSPAQGAEIELTTAEDGMYPIVTHAFNFVGRGALGLLQAGDGDPKN
jgi:nitrite reductase (NO-forming)